MANQCRCRVKLDGTNISQSEFEKTNMIINEKWFCVRGVSSNPAVIKMVCTYDWNPPWEVFRKLAEDGWGLNVKFLDENWNFVGQITHTTSNSLSVYEEWQTSRPWFLKQQLKLSGFGSKLINRKQLWEFSWIKMWISAHKYKPSREERNRPLEEGISVYRLQRSVLEKKK